jgi:hypothetical protein
VGVKKGCSFELCFLHVRKPRSVGAWSGAQKLSPGFGIFLAERMDCVPEIKLHLAACFA